MTFQISDLDVPEEGAAEGVEAESAAAEEAVADADAAAATYITCSLVITKAAHPSAMSVDLEAGEDGFEITNVAMFDKATAEDTSAQGDWERRSRYMGPCELAAQAAKVRLTGSVRAAGRGRAGRVPRLPRRAGRRRLAG